MGYLQNPNSNKMNLNADNSNVDVLTYNTSQLGTSLTEGKSSWDSIYQTLSVGMGNNVILQVGQELHVFGKASEAIANSDVCQYDGVQGDHILFKKAVPAEIAVNPRLILGVATENILQNGFGHITWYGNVNDVYTTGWGLEDILYFDPSTVGGLTNVKPIAPNSIISIGVVLKLATGEAQNGKIAVRPTFHDSISSLSDIYLDNLQNGDFLRYSSANERWENSAT